MTFSPTMGQVYFVRSVETGLIKIGWTEKWIVWRLKDLLGTRGTDETISLRVLALVDGPMRLEKTLHKTFRKYAAPDAFPLFGKECFRPGRMLLWFAKALPWQRGVGEVVVAGKRRNHAPKRCALCRALDHHRGNCPQSPHVGAQSLMPTGEPHNGNGCAA